jgi:hypothetical protein
MNLPLGRSSALSAQLERMNRDFDAIDRRVALDELERRRRELNEEIYLKAVRNFWLRWTLP